MATKQIGKLKLHWSKRGIAFKWDDGEIHRLSFERKKPDDAQGYAADQYDSQDGYDGQDYGQGGYQGQGYQGQGYDGQEDYYGAPPREGGRYDFLYTNDYLMYALLVLLPPLGIWILWKRERFTSMIRSIITAASGVWFVLLLVWLFTAMLSTGTDSIQTQSAATMPPTSTLTTPAPQDGSADLTVSATPAPTPISAVGSDTTDLTGTTGTTGTGTATGTATTDTSTVSASDYCYYTSTGQYFHSDKDCPDLGDNAIQATVAIARSRGLKECPSCYNTGAAIDATGTTGTGTSGTVIYATKNGKYYHVNKTCSNMKNAQVYTLNQAKKEGKKPCPTCIGQYYCTDTGKYYHLTKTCSGMKHAHLTTAKAAEAAGKVKCPVCLEKLAEKKGTTTSSATYYSTAKGKYYHVNKTCSGMKGAQKVTQAVIKQRGQTACPVCIGSKSTTSTSSGKYYATRNGTYYHTKSDCSGMKDATQITLATAKKYGKKACPVCVSTASTASANTTYYYATSAGKYYHKTSDCSGMKGAKKVTKAAAEKNGKTACPVCLKDMATYVYATSGGKYYHKTSTCSGMKDAKKVTLAAAKKNGKTACPTCYKAQVAKEAVYYATSAGKYYHVKAKCSGMKNATKVTLATATARGKTPCPVCLGKSTTYYYATKAGKYYHTKSGCSGMKNASKVTLLAAQKAGKLPCPVCVAKKSTATATPTPAPTSTANKVYCYASTGSKYYHKNQGCSGLTNLKKVLLSTAKSRGKTACPVCVTKTVKASNLTTNYADKQTICYASNASAYYHGDKNCVSGLSKTTVKAAKAKGKTACPTCAKNMNTYVYVTRSGTKYHRKSTCSGTVNAYKISLNTAIKLNYVRCTKCNAPKKN